ncbi:MAG: CoA transferase [Dehalococcoidia bacterium]
MPPPLDGVRVLDVGREIAGPLCARFFSRMGADVIKVEPPLGDPVRRASTRPGQARTGESSPGHLYANEGKRSVVIDLTTPSGRGVFLRLVRSADIVIENFEPSVLPDLGLGYETLRATNPAVILTSISGYGDGGPYRDFQSRELTLFAMGGHMFRSGAADRPPVRMGGHPTEVLAALGAAYATLAALRMRAAGGQHVTFSIFESQVTSHAQAMVEVSYYGMETGGEAPRGAAGIRGLLARDGLAMISAQEQQMPRLAALVGAPPELGQVDPMDRGGRRGELMERVAEWAAERTAREVYELGQGARVPASFVASPQDLLESPQYHHRNFIREVDQPGLGMVAIPGLPFKWPESEVPERPAPLLGEHTVEVLESVDVTREEIVRLTAAGVVA